jgi:peptide/nickel transport system ATP-binding protein
MSDLLQVQDLEIEFHTLGGVIKAVKGVSFRVKAGSTVAIVGESGSGKSVMAQAIMGILPRTARITGGKILFNNATAGSSQQETLDLASLDTRSKTFARIRGGQISMIFQEPMTSLSPLHTIGDQIGESLAIHGVKADGQSGTARKSEIRQTTIDMLRLVGFPNPDEAFDTYPFELSGGLRQRAMIAMALICGPSLLIADEPTTALDVTVQAQILKLIKDMQARLGMAVLIITHDLGVVANVADEVVVVYRGKVMESGMLDDIFNNPQHPYLCALLNAVPHLGMEGDVRLKPIREIKVNTENLLSLTRSGPAAPGSETPGYKTTRHGTLKHDPSGPMLEIKNLTKAFSIRKSRQLFSKQPSETITALDNVSLSVKRGSCLGLVGESGCGKTTLSKIVMRACDADQGQVLFNDGASTINLLDMGSRQMEPIRCKIQYVFQDPFSSLNPRATILDTISEPLVIHNIGDHESRCKKVLELMELVGLDGQLLNRYPHSFSGGQRQRIVIARALALNPDLLICDEPVSALDVSIQAQILNLLKDLQRELGLTYLFISHNLAVVDYIADTIAVMCAGHLVELAPSHELFSNPLHPYTKALISAVPVPDPGRMLDFSALVAGKTSDPTAWAHPFGDDAGDGSSGKPGMVDMGAGHYVRAHEQPTQERKTGGSHG